MVRVEREKFPFYQFEHLSGCPGIRHFVSSGKKNIGFTDGIDPNEIRRNRQELAECVGMDMGKLVAAHQIHSANVTVVTSRDAGRGALDKESRLPDTDAMITHEEGICLMVLSADCVPVLLYDPENRVIAAVHAGWRGTAAKIVVETVRAMQEKYGCKPEHLLAGIGPSIGPCCFEVGQEVADVFRNLFPGNRDLVKVATPVGKFRVDLWKANRMELLDAGLQAENIEIARLCSVCHPDHFFSYRRDGQAAGRFGAGIALSGAQSAKCENL